MKRLWIVILPLLLGSASAEAQQPAQDTTAAKHSSAPPGNAPKYDTHLPIEISSDTLEVLQHENKAIFKGNVVAVQGKLRLKSDVMVVHYKQKKEEPGTGKPEPKPQAPPQPDQSQGAMGAITRIDVEGNVFVASPEESAKGDKGDYDVETKTIHLFGDNVTLTRDKNILRGTALEYNLETGRSLLTNGTDVVNGKPGGRVRGVFVPAEEPAKPAKPGQAKPGQAATTPGTNNQDKK